MKIATFNINGIRAAVTKGLWEWVEKESPDYLGVQEVKALEMQADLDKIREMGYHVFWHAAQKKGYSGVAVFTKNKPHTVIHGMGIEKYDMEGRVIRTDFENVSIVNCYFPSGSSGEERHAFKLEFLADMEKWMSDLLTAKKKVIVVGDYNIVHTAMDIHNPDRKDNPSGYRPEERAWMDHWFRLGFTDAYRYKNPESIEFSWWSYRANSRNKDKGWRIDYCSVSDDIRGKITRCYHQKEAFFSDHCPVVLEMDL